MFSEANLNRVQEVTAKDIPSDLSSTECHSQRKLAKEFMRHYDVVPPRVNRGTSSWTEGNRFTPIKLNAERSRDSTVEQRVLGPRIKVGLNIETLRIRVWGPNLDHQPRK
jgi:hypothetical protein